jgi:hypothetical protein
MLPPPRKRNNIAIGTGVVSVVLAILVILMAFGYIPTMQSNAYLVNVGLGSSSDGSNSLIIHGYVVNAGTTNAYDTKLHVVAYYVTGAKAIDTYVPIGTGTINGREALLIDTSVPYTSGANIAASTATITPQWKNTP